MPPGARWCAGAMDEMLVAAGANRAPEGITPQISSNGRRPSSPQATYGLHNSECGGWT
jgi:hypothetical protein